MHRKGVPAAVVGERVKAVEAVEMSWAEIVEEARKTEELWVADASMAWYRGHADETWDLKSTLHRNRRLREGDEDASAAGRPSGPAS